MGTMTDFEREIRLLLTEIDSECKKLEARVQQAQETLESAKRKRSTLQEALDIYREHYRLPASVTVVDEAMRQKLVGKTIKEMIVTVAMENQPPMFRVIDMNRALMKAGMFKDEDSARDSVYSTIGRNPKTFIKVTKGQYLVNPERLQSTLHVNAEGPLASQSGGNLRAKVVSILRAHPDWSRQQTLAELQRDGWDFGGKKPIFAVGACYAGLKSTAKQSAPAEDGSLP